MPKLIYTNKDIDFYDRLESGVSKVADMVKVTFGVSGRNVGLRLYRNSLPLLTNDGVSVASQIESDDDIEDFAIVLAKEAAHRTEDTAGDGTTSTLVILQALVSYGMKLKKQGMSPLKLRQQIEEATKQCIKEVAKLAKPARAKKILAYAATISCRDAEIGSLIARVVAKAKKDGMITLEDNLGGKTKITQLEGLQLRAGYLAKNFINQPETQQIIMDNPAFLVTNMNLTSVNEIQIIAENAAKANIKDLVIFGENIGHDFMTTAYINWQEKGSAFKILPVRFNTASDIADGMLRDLAAVSGAKFIDTFVGEGMTDISPDAFGRVKKFIQSKKETLIVPGNDELVTRRVLELKGELKDTKEYQAENIRERIARLRRSCFTIQVGGITETELQERKTRVKDALNTAQAAYELGVVPGGGAALALAAEYIKDMEGAEIVQQACRRPMEQLLANGDFNLKLSVDELRHGKTLDCTSGKVVDAFETGIIDSTVAVTQSLRNAASEAIQLLLTEGIIIDPNIKEE